VFWDDDETAVERVGCFAVGTSPLYTVPSSPAEKVNVEQKPSEEVINNVDPSFALSLVSTYCSGVHRHTMLDQ